MADWVNANVTGVSATVGLGTANAVEGQTIILDRVAGMRVYGTAPVIRGDIYTYDYAYPGITPLGTSQGLTKRQWYAGQALMGLMANPDTLNMPGQSLTNPGGGKGLALMAFAAADAMLDYEIAEAEGWTPPLAGSERPEPKGPQSAPATATPEEMAVAMRLAAE